MDQALLAVFQKLAQVKPNEDVLKTVTENRLLFPRITKYNTIAKIEAITNNNLLQLRENLNNPNENLNPPFLTEKQAKRLQNMNICLLGKRAFLNIKTKHVEPEKMGLDMLRSAMIWINTQSVLMKDVPKNKDDSSDVYQKEMFEVLAHYYQVGTVLQHYKDTRLNNEEKKNAIN